MPEYCEIDFSKKYSNNGHEIDGIFIFENSYYSNGGHKNYKVEEKCLTADIEICTKPKWGGGANYEANHGLYAKCRRQNIWKNEQFKGSKNNGYNDSFSNFEPIRGDIHNPSYIWLAEYDGKIGAVDTISSLSNGEVGSPISYSMGQLDGVIANSAKVERYDVRFYSDGSQKAVELDEQGNIVKPFSDPPVDLVMLDKANNGTKLSPSDSTTAKNGKYLWGKTDYKRTWSQAKSGSATVPISADGSELKEM